MDVVDTCGGEAEGLVDGDTSRGEREGGLMDGDKWRRRRIGGW